MNDEVLGASSVGQATVVGDDAVDCQRLSRGKVDGIARAELTRGQASGVVEELVGHVDQETRTEDPACVGPRFRGRICDRHRSENLDLRDPTGCDEALLLLQKPDQAVALGLANDTLDESR